MHQLRRYICDFCMQNRRQYRGDGFGQYHRAGVMLFRRSDIRLRYRSMMPDTIVC